MPDFSFNDPELIKEFLSEFEETVSSIDRHLLELQKEPGNPERLQEIFRSVHTIKGASSYLNLAALGEFAHKLETLTDRLRKGSLPPSAPTLEVIRRANGVLKQFLDCCVKTGADKCVDASEMSREIDAILSEK